MNTHREIAYRLDPALWVREVLGMSPHGVAGEISARTTRGIHSGADGAAGRQNHHRGLGDCAFHGFYCRVVVRDRLSGATAKCGSGAAGAGGPHQGGRRA